MNRAKPSIDTAIRDKPCWPRNVRFARDPLKLSDATELSFQNGAMKEPVRMLLAKGHTEAS
jgi:hypothetical protein